MGMAGTPPDAPVPGERPTVRIVQLDQATLRALADGDLDTANRVSDIVLPPYFVSAERRRTWRMRSRQVEADPACAAWITGAIFDPGRRVAVGTAGFHGPPDADGMVEVGYAVDPAHRRRGYARAALEELLGRAARESDVRVVRACVRPDNRASNRLVAQYGFVEVGEQWDEEDGREIVFEAPANPRPPGAGAKE